MNNKGHTTLLFSLIITILFLFTITAHEVSRIHMSNVKMNACVHSMCSSILADYNEELFERYHLLFMDPTYGTGSEAAIEEKIKDYLETSLNGEKGNKLYAFSVDEVAVSDKRTILSSNMKLLKEQIKEYEKTADLTRKVSDLVQALTEKKTNIKTAAKETEINARELNLPAESDKSNSQEDNEKVNTDEEKKEVEDPRQVLENSLKLGILEFVIPGNNYSKEKHKTDNLPSREYKEQQKQEKSSNFQDVGVLQSVLDGASDENMVERLKEHSAFATYVMAHCSNGVNELENAVMKCEVEYILKGKDNDYDNLEAVVKELTWWRMPINYAYLLTDMEKKGVALTCATAICIATGTEPFIEIVKYLLLGCWAYGESLYEMGLLLSGQNIPYVKTPLTWYTDLETLATTKEPVTESKGLSYEDCLMLLLAKKCGESLNTGYARILDVIQLNLQKSYTSFHISDCVGAMVIQGKISFDSMFYSADEDNYNYYFEEEVSYEE